MNPLPIRDSISRFLPVGAVASLAAGALAFLPCSVQAEPDAQMKAVLDAYAVLSPIPLEKTNPEVAKHAPSLAAAVKAVALKEGKKSPPFTGTTEDIKIPLSGAEVAARVYIPAGEGPFPTILYIHGGGWVIGDIDVYDSSPRMLCELTKAVVVSTDYRRAPDYKFPVAHDDTFVAYKWVLENAGKYKANTKKTAIAGESAGGNMAAAICIKAKESGIQLPVYQLLVYPVTNYAFDTASDKANETTKPLSTAGLKWFYSYYLDKPEDGANPRFSILQATDLKGLPPTTIIAAEIDPLLSEGEAFAEKLKAAGVPVNYQLYKGVTHEFFGMGAVVDKAKEAMSVAAADLNTAFAK